MWGIENIPVGGFLTGQEGLFDFKSDTLPKQFYTGAFVTLI